MQLVWLINLMEPDVGDYPDKDFSQDENAKTETSANKINDAAPNQGYDQDGGLMQVLIVRCDRISSFIKVCDYLIRRQVGLVDV